MKETRRTNWRPSLAAFLLTGLAMSGVGCVTTDVFKTARAPLGGSHAKVARVMTLWDTRVHLASDPLNQGKQYPVIAGRMVLFGEGASKPLIVKGSVVAQIYDVTNPPAPGTELTPYRVELTHEQLKHLVREDFLGQAYTIVLPWFDYNPEIRRVRIQLTFTPEGGGPIYDEPAVITLRRDTGPMEIRSRVDTPSTTTHVRPPAANQPTPQQLQQFQQAPPPRFPPMPQSLQQPEPQPRQP